LEASNIQWSRTLDAETHSFSWDKQPAVAVFLIRRATDDDQRRPLPAWDRNGTHVDADGAGPASCGWQAVQRSSTSQR